jgi:hypothetical protein
MASRVSAVDLFPPLSARLRAELFAALAEVEIEPCAVTPVVSDPPWRAPSAYRVVAADGREFKVRIGQRARLAARNALLAAHLGDPALVAPVARVGRVTVERWVAGQTLSEVRLLGRHVDEASALLGRIHGFTGVPGERLPQQRRVDPVIERVGRHVAQLVDDGVVTRPDAADVRRIARALPATATWGLIHSDICPQNLVVRLDATLASIDNERLGRGFLEADLARTWYRWPMPARTWVRFEGNYRAGAAPLAPDVQHAWRVVVVLRTLHMRWRLRASMDEPHGALRTLLARG